jgi:hypothetical protein
MRGMRDMKEAEDGMTKFPNLPNDQIRRERQGGMKE